MRAASGYVDPLGVVLAVATGLAIVALQDGVIVAAAAALSVLAVRVVAGILAVRRSRPSDPRTTLLPATWHEPLSPKEAEVALLVAEGLRDKEIAARLDRDVKTVQTHLSHCFDKLADGTGTPFHNRAQVAVWITERRARAAGQTPPEAPGRKSVPK
jgi:DNA-binding NarL/FixJ family response regulator